MYTDPLPSGRDLQAMYLDHEQFTSDHYTSQERVDAILDYMTTSLERVRGRQRVAGTTAARILEVGAGRAWMCRAAKGLNPASKTVAQDISGEVRESCPWVDKYIQGEVGDSQLRREGPYDVISITHVIEHLTDPVDVIRHCMKLLARDGLIYITAPHRPLGWTAGNADISLWRDYSLSHVPAHIQYFSSESMEKLARAAKAELAYWSHDHEGGQAFEAWLSHRTPRTTSQRVLRRLGLF